MCIRDRDWMMPKVGGIEVCRRLKMRPETRLIPIIMLSARAEEVDRIRGLETGADDYVIKPYSVLELMARARAQLRRAGPHLCRRGRAVCIRGRARAGPRPPPRGPADGLAPPQGQRRPGGRPPPPPGPRGRIAAAAEPCAAAPAWPTAIDPHLRWAW